MNQKEIFVKYKMRFNNLTKLSINCFFSLIISLKVNGPKLGGCNVYINYESGCDKTLF
jgi:hypothetical protein